MKYEYGALVEWCWCGNSEVNGDKPVHYHLVRHWPGVMQESCKDIDLYTTIVLAFYGSIEALFRMALKRITISSHAGP